MNKPTVFNAIKAMQKIEELEAEVRRLQEEKTNLEIRCRIAETKLKEEEHEVHS